MATLDLVAGWDQSVSAAFGALRGFVGHVFPDVVDRTLNVCPGRRAGLRLPVAADLGFDLRPRATTAAGLVGGLPSPAIDRLHLLPGRVAGAVVLLPEHFVTRDNVLPAIGHVDRLGYRLACGGCVLAIATHQFGALGLNVARGESEQALARRAIVLTGIDHDQSMPRFVLERVEARLAFGHASV